MALSTPVFPEAPWYSKEIYRGVVRWSEVDWFKAISSRYAMNMVLSEEFQTPDIQKLNHQILLDFFEHLERDPILSHGAYYGESGRAYAALPLPAKVVYDLDEVPIKNFSHTVGFQGAMVDIFAPDAVITPAIKAWLAEKREVHEFRPTAITQADMRQWVDASVIEYVDLDIWLRFKGIRVSGSRIADVLFPQLQVDRVEKLRKVTRRHAKTILSVETYRRFAAQQSAGNWKEKF